MPPDDDVRLRHLFESAETAIGLVKGRSRAYFDIDLDVLWSTIVLDLPALLNGLPRPEPTA